MIAEQRENGKRGRVMKEGGTGRGGWKEEGRRDERRRMDLTKTASSVVSKLFSRVDGKMNVIVGGTVAAWRKQMLLEPKLL